MLGLKAGKPRTLFRCRRSQLTKSISVPNGAQLQFHLIDGCPALVIPVLPKTPVLAWSQYTLLPPAPP